MASPLCDTGFFANDVLCEVINNLDALNVVADGLRVDAEAALEDLKTTSETGVANLSDIDYSADTSGIPLDYVAPTYSADEPDFSGEAPTAPVVPAGYVVPPADTMLISDTVFDNAFDKASARLARVNVKEERDASYTAASMGLGLPSAALLTRLAQAQEQGNLKVSEVALEATIKEGEWLREDAKVLHGFQIQNWPLKPQADIQLFVASSQSSMAYLTQETARFGARLEQLKLDIASEGERRGWSDLQVRNELEQADKATSLALQKATAILATTQQAETAIAQLLAGLAQAVYSAANYDLGGRASQSVNSTVSETV